MGKETTPGTSVAPSIYMPHLALTLDPKTTVVQNNSAMGRLEDINDSQVTEQWAEGSVQAKVFDQAIGLPLLNLFGTVSAALHSGESTVYDNTFTVNNASVPPSLTFGRINPVEKLRYALGFFSDFELEVAVGDWAKFTGSIMAKVGATSTDTAAYPSPAENEFTSKHLTVKIASAVGGLSGATALDIKSIKLKITRKLDRYTPFGAIDPSSFDLNEWNVTGEVVGRFTSNTLEAIGNANTRQAMSISLVNSDVTIGSAAHPSVIFTMPKIRFAPMTLDNNLNQPLSQTVAFSGELDVSAGYTLQSVVTNTKNGY